MLILEGRVIRRDVPAAGDVSADAVLGAALASLVSIPEVDRLVPPVVEVGGTRLVVVPLSGWVTIQREDSAVPDVADVAGTIAEVEGTAGAEVFVSGGLDVESREEGSKLPVVHGIPV